MNRETFACAGSFRPLNTCQAFAHGFYEQTHPPAFTRVAGVFFVRRARRRAPRSRSYGPFVVSTFCRRHTAGIGTCASRRVASSVIGCCPIQIGSCDREHDSNSQLSLLRAHPAGNGRGHGNITAALRRRWQLPELRWTEALRPVSSQLLPRLERWRPPL